MKKSSKSEVLIQCLFQIIISNISLIFYVLLSSVYMRNENTLLLLSIPTILALTVHPVIFEETIFKSEENFSNYLWIDGFSLVIMTVIAFLNLGKNEIMIIHFIFIAYSEEFLYRRLILDKLRTSYSDFYAILVSSAMFALLGHISEPIWDNLLIRFPLGIILAVIKEKSNSIFPGVIVHSLYNIVLTL